MFSVFFTTVYNYHSTVIKVCYTLLSFFTFFYNLYYHIFTRYSNWFNSICKLVYI